MGPTLAPRRITGGCSESATFCGSYSPWLFGHEKPFIQGLCTINFVLKALIAARMGTTREISIQFVRKAYVAQNVEIRFTRDRYEARDEDGKIIATGNYVAKAPAASMPRVA